MDDDAGFVPNSSTVNIISEDSQDATTANGESFREESGAFGLQAGFRAFEVSVFGGRTSGAGECRQRGADAE